MKAELKPCPFCGGKSERGVWHTSVGWYECVARCLLCGAEIRKRYVPFRDENNAETNAKRYISKMWNRRVKENETG